jgi:hypothetical protein
MATYNQRVRQSILPPSIADTLPIAFEEWRAHNPEEETFPKYS